MDHFVRYRERFKRMKQKMGPSAHVCVVHVVSDTTRVLMDSHSRTINAVTSRYVRLDPSTVRVCPWRFASRWFVQERQGQYELYGITAVCDIQNRGRRTCLKIHHSRARHADAFSSACLPKTPLKFSPSFRSGTYRELLLPGLIQLVASNWQLDVESTFLWRQIK